MMILLFFILLLLLLYIIIIFCCVVLLLGVCPSHQCSKINHSLLDVVVSHSHPSLRQRRTNSFYEEVALTRQTKMHLAQALRRSSIRPLKAQQLLVRNLSAATVKPNGLELYREKYARSLEPEYWGEVAAKNFHWEQPFSDKNILSYNFKKSKGPIFVKWFEDGKTNVCFNAVDRWAKECPDKTALIYEGNDGESKRMSFSELLSQVCQVANVLQQTCGVQKGDRVLYMPMTSSFQ